MRACRSVSAGRCPESTKWAITRTRTAWCSPIPGSISRGYGYGTMPAQSRSHEPVPRDLTHLGATIAGAQAFTMAEPVGFELLSGPSDQATLAKLPCVLAGIGYSEVDLGTARSWTVVGFLWGLPDGRMVGECPQALRRHNCLVRCGARRARRTRCRARRRRAGRTISLSRRCLKLPGCSKRKSAKSSAASATPLPQRSTESPRDSAK